MSGYWTPLGASASSLIPPTYVSDIVIANGQSALTANRAYLMPISFLVTPFTFSRVMRGIALNGGNTDLGVYYSDDEATFTRLWSSGSFVSPNGPNLHVLTIGTPQTLTPQIGRRWFTACSIDNGSAQVSVDSVSSTRQMTPVFIKDTSFPLPAVLTAMTGPSGNNVNIPHLILGI